MMEHLMGRRWRTSSYTESGGANCVDVDTDAGAVIVVVRDIRAEPVLRFSLTTWRHLAGHVKADAPCLRSPGMRMYIAGTSLTV